jgi:hypothetical protein
VGVAFGRSADQMKVGISLIATCCLVFVAGSEGLGQSSADAQPETILPPCSEDVAKVRVQTTVMGVQSKAFLKGLTADKFRLRSGSEIFDFQCFSPPDQSYSVGFVLDYSSSMKPHGTELVLKGIAAFIHAANPSNIYFSIGFGSEPFVLLEPTSDTKRVVEFLSDAAKRKRSGRSSLNDAVEMAMGKFPAKNSRRRILLIMSDGDDNYSRLSNSDKVAKRLRLANVRAFAAKIYDGDALRNWMQQSTEIGRLGNFISETGGTGVWLTSVASSEKYFESLSRTLREEYTLGFTPKKAEGKWRPLEYAVKLPRDFEPVTTSGVPRFYY